MKAILISIKPKYCALMKNGKKKIDVRKGTALYKATQKLIDEYGFAEFYVYCTKEKPYFFESDWSDNEGRCCVIPNELNKAIEHVKSKLRYGKEYIGCPFILYGTPYGNLLEKRKYYSSKVIFKFRCYKVEEVGMWNYSEYGTKTLMENSLCIYSCLNYFELKNYIKEKPSTAIHISDLEIFDEPKELSEFKSYKKNIVNTKINGMVFETELDNSLIKAPQSWQFIETEELL